LVLMLRFMTISETFFQTEKMTVDYFVDHFHARLLAGNQSLGQNQAGRTGTFKAKKLHELSWRSCLWHLSVQN
jgi:hypothetical protein